MIVTLVLACVVLATVIIEVLFPGSPGFHNGWFIVALTALVVILALRVHRGFAMLRTNTGRAGFVVTSFGVGAVALAGVAFGLFAPDPQTVIGAPGATVDVEGAHVSFPLATDRAFTTTLQGATILNPVSRTVVGVDVADRSGRHLTITQPTGTAFLSPILLMQATQKIAGLTVPYDSFAVPAMHRMVKAVLLDRAAISQMPALAASATSGVVLFDVEDENEVAIPHGIGVARDGQSIDLGGLTLRPNLLSYPAIRVIPLPNPVAVALGLLAAIVGIALVGVDVSAGPRLV